VVSNYELVWHCILEYSNGTLPEGTLLAVLAADDSIIAPPVGFNERLHARIEESLRNAGAEFGNRTAGRD
jgi:hypothetical protein